MKKLPRIVAITFGITSIALLVVLIPLRHRIGFLNSGGSSIHSHYAGQEIRRIKALSESDIEGLLAGEGTPFGGMAKTAELSGYPGPRHVLDAYEEGEIDLSTDQFVQIESMYNEMRSEAIKLGEKIIYVERVLDDAFDSGEISLAILQDKVNESAALYGELRIVHLRYHLSMMDILTVHQIENYNELRGYATVNHGEAVSEGHDPETWKLHNVHS